MSPGCVLQDTHTAPALSCQPKGSSVSKVPVAGQHAEPWHAGDLSPRRRRDSAQGTARAGHAHLKAVSSTFSWSLVTSSGMRDRWEICVAAQPNWKMTMKGR